MCTCVEMNCHSKTPQILIRPFPFIYYLISPWLKIRLSSSLTNLDETPLARDEEECVLQNTNLFPPCNLAVIMPHYNGGLRKCLHKPGRRRGKGPRAANSSAGVITKHQSSDICDSAAKTLGVLCQPALFSSS